MDTKRSVEQQLEAVEAEARRITQCCNLSGDMIRERNAAELRRVLEAMRAGAAQAAAPAQAGEYPKLPEPWRIGAGGAEAACYSAAQMRAYVDSDRAARGAAQAAHADAAVQRDAARYRFLRDGIWRRTDLESVIRLQLNTLWDRKIDAAIDAQKGSND